MVRGIYYRLGTNFRRAIRRYYLPDTVDPRGPKAK